MNRRRFVVESGRASLLAGLWNRSLPAQSGSASAAKSKTAGAPLLRLPFQLLANCPFVPVKINGRGPFNFEVDTGSSSSPFARELAEEMGFDPRPNVRSGQPTEVRLADNFAVKIPASFASFAGLWPLIGRRTYGDIGFGVLKNYVVQFDYESRELNFFDPDKFQYNGPGISLPAVLVNNYDPQFEGELVVDGIPPIKTKFTLDTGAGGTVVSVPIVREFDLVNRVKQQIPLPRSKPKVDGVNGLIYQAIVGRIAGLKIGNFTLQQPLVALSRDTDTIFARDVLGVNLGGNILRRFMLFVDYPGKRVIFEPNRFFRDPFPADAAGLVLSATGDNFKTIVVHGVIPGSPADRSGLKEGDVITAIDGQSTDRYALWEIQDLFKQSGHRCNITFSRGNAGKTVAVELHALA